VGKWNDALALIPLQGSLHVARVVCGWSDQGLKAGGSGRSATLGSLLKAAFCDPTPLIISQLKACSLAVFTLDGI
jgi:hypothetical protein